VLERLLHEELLIDEAPKGLGGRLLRLVRRDSVAARDRVIDLMHSNLVAVDFRDDLTRAFLDISLAARRQREHQRDQHRCAGTWLDHRFRIAQRHFLAIYW